MASEGEGGGAGGVGGGSRKRTQAELRQVPWQTWREWRAVRSALFSGRPSSIRAALDRIAAWHSRGDVPVSVEISRQLITIHQRDPNISAGLPVEMGLPEEILRLSYSMALLRLVNGVVDKSQKRNSTSVATRAELVGLSRLLVDVRHESSHNELPSISLLRLGSKEALSWLELHYWKFQEQKLLDTQTQLKSCLMEYIGLLLKTLSETSSQDPSNDDGVGAVVDRRQLKRARKALKQQQNMQFENLLELSSSACSDLVSILLAEGFLEQQFLPGQEHPQEAPSVSSEESGKQDPTGDSPCGGLLEDQAARVCKYIINRLAAHMPELPLMLLTAIIDRLCERKRPEEPLLERQASLILSIQESAQQKETMNSSAVVRLIDWSAWLLGEGEAGEETKVFPEKSHKVRADQVLNGSARVGGLTDQLLRELLLKCLCSVPANRPLWKLITLLVRRIGNKCLSQQAVVLAKLGTLDSQTASQNVFSGNDKSGELNTLSCNQSTDHVKNGPVSGTPEPMDGLLCVVGASNELSQGNDLVATMQHRKPQAAVCHTSEVSLADAKEQQMAFIRRHVQRRARKARTSDDASTKWRLMSDWTPCPVGLLPAGRVMGFENFDDVDGNLDKAVGAERVGDPATHVCPPFGDVAAPSPPSRSNIQGRSTAISTSPEPSDGVEAVKDVLSAKQRRAQREGSTPYMQEARPLKGCILQNGSFRQCGDELLAILQASIHVL